MSNLFETFENLIRKSFASPWDVLDLMKKHLAEFGDDLARIQEEGESGGKDPEVLPDEEPEEVKEEETEEPEPETKVLPDEKKEPSPLDNFRQSIVFSELLRPPLSLREDKEGKS